LSLNFLDGLYIFPFILKSNIEEIDILNLKIRKIKKEERTMISKIEKAPLVDSEHIAFKDNFFNKCNYVVETCIQNQNFNDISLFDNCIRMFELSNAGLHIGFNFNNKFMKYFHQLGTSKPHCQLLQTLELNESKIENLKSLFENLIKTDKKPSEKDKLELVLKRYRRASSYAAGGRITLDDRILDIAIILEILYLSDARDELTYKISTRIANLFKKKIDDSISAYEFYNKAKTFYKLRSAIVHSGKSKNKSENNNYFLEFLEIARKSIILFIEDPEIFKSENLERICFDS